jgi:glutamate racemase
VNVIDPAPAIARQTGRVLAERSLSAPELHAGRRVFCTSGDGGAFRNVLARLVSADGQIEVAAWRGDRAVREIR